MNRETVVDENYWCCCSCFVATLLLACLFAIVNVCSCCSYNYIYRENIVIFGLKRNSHILYSTTARISGSYCVCHAIGLLKLCLAESIAGWLASCLAGWLTTALLLYVSNMPQTMQTNYFYNSLTLNMVFGHSFILSFVYVCMCMCMCKRVLHRHDKFYNICMLQHVIINNCLNILWVFLCVCVYTICCFFEFFNMFARMYVHIYVGREDSVINKWILEFCLLYNIENCLTIDRKSGWQLLLNKRFSTLEIFFFVFIVLLVLVITKWCVFLKLMKYTYKNNTYTHSHTHAIMAVSLCKG